MDGLFKKLEDKAFFIEFVTARYKNVPTEITSAIWCKQTIDPKRVEFAYSEYCGSIKHFALYLESENPDHYKRAGALLHALYTADIAQFEMLPQANEAECGFAKEHLDSGLNVGDRKHTISWLSFWDAFHNQALAFDVAYRCCCSYEQYPTDLTVEYLHNVCRYLKQWNKLTVDDCFMLFRSLMLQNPAR